MIIFSIIQRQEKTKKQKKTKNKNKKYKTAKKNKKTKKNKKLLFFNRRIYSGGWEPRSRSLHLAEHPDTRDRHNLA